MSVQQIINPIGGKIYSNLIPSSGTTGGIVSTIYGASFPAVGNVPAGNVAFDYSVVTSVVNSASIPYFPPLFNENNGWKIEATINGQANFSSTSANQKLVFGFVISQGANLTPGVFAYNSYGGIPNFTTGSVIQQYQQANPDASGNYYFSGTTFDYFENNGIGFDSLQPSTIQFYLLMTGNAVPAITSAASDINICFTITPVQVV